MDHNGVHTADDNVDATQRRRAGSRRDGEDSMLATEGDIDKRQRDSDEESEETPLLVDGSTNGQANGDHSRRQSVYRPWEEFADLPWWKKPHVSLLSLAICIWIRE
jgi:hypothetical protein